MYLQYLLSDTNVLHKNISSSIDALYMLYYIIHILLYTFVLPKLLLLLT